MLKKEKISNKQVILIAVLCIILGISLLGHDYFLAKKDKVYEKMSFELSSMPEEINDNTLNSDEELSDDDEDDLISGEKNIISEKDSSYYLVKSVDGKVKVFFVNESGEPLELETTEIVYDLLSTADQKLFDEGCKVESQEELAVLLQDFES